MCNSETLPGIFSIVKRIILLIQIIVPILLIVFASISLIKLLKNPEEKKGTKKIVNQFIAAVIVFFIPLLVDVVMNLAGDSNEISSCWMSASDKNIINTEYQSSTETERKKITYDATDYEKGVPSQLDFSCKSDIVRSQFSCDTLKRVEKHLYDFDATTFDNVINRKYGGDFGRYAKSVGGIFSEYYGKTIKGRTATDFQIAAEYILGWMYIYGWDGGYIFEHGGKWGSCYNNGGYAPDAFYINGGWISQLNWRPWNSWEEGLRNAFTGSADREVNFDDIISGKCRGGIHGLIVICGDAPNFIYGKLGLYDEPILRGAKVRLKDVKVGDLMLFRNSQTGRSHGAVVGEVYNDHIVVYDTGGSYIQTMNYKRTIEIPKESSPEADLAAINKLYSPGLAAEWDIMRYANFE